jgi:hypothetical protein
MCVVCMTTLSLRLPTMYGSPVIELHFPENFKSFITVSILMVFSTGMYCQSVHIDTDGPRYRSGSWLLCTSLLILIVLF